VPIAEAVQLFEEQVLPGLREQDGYEGVIVLANPEGPGAIVSFWDTEEDAAAAADFATESIELFVTMFRAPAGREQYEVVLAELPDVVVS